MIVYHYRSIILWIARVLKLCCSMKQSMLFVVTGSSRRMFQFCDGWKRCKPPQGVPSLFERICICSKESLQYWLVNDEMRIDR